MTGIGARLQEVRRGTGLSQEKFAAEFGLSDRGYKNYELEKRQAPVSFLIDVCDRFNLRTDWLLRGQGAKNAEETRRLAELASQTVRAFIEKAGVSVSVARERELADTVFAYYEEHGTSNAKFVSFFLETCIIPRNRGSASSPDAR
jgi:transcriptional regulator with XRE-family HTH domain